jgi:hypothetical protein
VLGASEDIHLLTFDAVTTYADRHWDEYARRFVESFDRHWKGVKLRAYTDDKLEQSDWLPEFKQRHRHRSTDNYRFDAVRFAHKVAALELAYRIGTADVMVWIDADCVTHADVDAEWLSSLIGDGDFAYLRREKKYPECGFMMFRRNAETSEMLRRLVFLYRSDDLFSLQEWHDSWAIEQVRLGMDDLKCVSLSGDYESTGHPFVNGPLGARLDHCKGKRKSAGKSKQSDLKNARDEDYWRYG